MSQISVSNSRAVPTKRVPSSYFLAPHNFIDVSAEGIIKFVFSEMGVSLASINTKRGARTITDTKAMAAYTLRMFTELRYIEIGKLLNCDHSNICHYLNICRAQISINSAFAKRLTSIINKLAGQ